MKILITGGAGFIGSWVADACLESGHEVLVIDDLSTGVAENVPDGALFREADIRDETLLNEVVADFRPDIINHHAAQIDVRKSVENPVFDAGVNVLGTLNLLQAAVRHDVGRFIFASTGGAIYGEPDKLPADESAEPMPISPYGVSKYAAEKYMEFYRFLYSIEYVALRYANVYGPRQNPHGEAGVIAIFCGKILSGQDCLIFGDGSQTRDYVYAGDVAKANLLAITAPSGSYNIGTGVETSVNVLISELRNASGLDFGVKYEAPRPGEVQSISLDAGRARRVLGWSSETTLAEGIKGTYAWFTDHSG